MKASHTHKKKNIKKGHPGGCVPIFFTPNLILLLLLTWPSTGWSKVNDKNCLEDQFRALCKTLNSNTKKGFLSATPLGLGIKRWKKINNCLKENFYPWAEDLNSVQRTLSRNKQLGNEVMKEGNVWKELRTLLNKQDSISAGTDGGPHSWVCTH